MGKSGWLKRKALKRGTELSQVVTCQCCCQAASANDAIIDQANAALRPAVAAAGRVVWRAGSSAGARVRSSSASISTRELRRTTSRLDDLRRR